jgi:hypothetical protein
MTATVDDGEPVEIRLDQLLVLRNVTAGLDWAVIGLHVVKLRKTNLPVDPPIRVYPEGDTGFFRIADGRHRFVASLVSGRDTVLAVIEDKVAP